MKTRKINEHGQAIVLLTLGILAMIGFVALSIDGGMVYSDRRMIQSVSDAASLAGGGFAAMSLENYGITYSAFSCSDPDVTTIRNNAAIVATNHAINNGMDPANVTVTTVCEDNGSGADPKYIDIITQVEKEVKTALIHLVYQGTVANTTSATVRVKPRNPLANGNAIVALNPNPCQGNMNGATFHGTSNTYVYGGGIWTNGCLRGRGNADVIVQDGGIGYVVEYDHKGCHLNISPTPQKHSDIIPPEDYYIPPPNCNDPAAHNVSANNLPSDLSPGLWCISGTLRVNAQDVLTGDGVTLYLLDGRLQINGSATVQLKAPEQSPDPSPALPGVVIMMAPGNSNRIMITGNSESYFYGTILAPESDVELMGTGETDAYHAQIIAYNVDLKGNADLIVHYFENTEFSTPATIDLYK